MVEEFLNASKFAFVTKENSGAPVLICRLAEVAVLYHMDALNALSIGWVTSPHCDCHLTCSVGSSGSCQHLLAGCQFWVGQEQEKSYIRSRLCYKLPYSLGPSESAHSSRLERSMANRDAVWSLWQSLIISPGLWNKSHHLMQTIYSPFQSSFYGWKHQRLNMWLLDTK